jgi:dihydrodipicolinate synthase/N-acetylneuraminate lyase
MAHYLLKGPMVGRSGVIAGRSKVAPKECVKGLDLFREAMYDEIIRARKVLSKGDWVLKGGEIVGTKASLDASLRLSGR